MDTLIMGCTHYPILLNSIRKAAGNSVSLVDSGQALALRLQMDFASGILQRSPRAGLRLVMTDLSSHTKKWAMTLLQEHPDFPVEKVDL